MKFKQHQLLFSISIILLLGMAGSSQAIPTALYNLETQSLIDQQVEILDFRGINYGHYRLADGGPGANEIVSETDIREDLQIMKNLGVTDIRTYRLSDGLENLPIMSQEYGITTSIVTWIAPWMTDEQIFGGIDEALSFENESSMTILGNEPLLRGEYSPAEYQQFIDYANSKKSTNSKIALAEPHYIFKNSPQLVENITTLMVHIYPAWEGVPIQDAANYTITEFLEVRDQYPDKELYLGEFGWPSGPGGPFTEENQKKYYDDIMPMLLEHNIDPYIFSIFDEEWKSEVYSGDGVAYEIGPHWGIFDEDREGKPASVTVAQYYGGETVERTYSPPQSNTPDDITTEIGTSIKISWIITDGDSNKGTFTLYKNNQLFGQEDLPWEDSVPIEISVDISIAGTYEYKLEFTDGENMMKDTVVVTVIDPNATTDNLNAGIVMTLTVAIIPMTRKIKRYLD